MDITDVEKAVHEPIVTEIDKVLIIPIEMPSTDVAYDPDKNGLSDKFDDFPELVKSIDASEINKSMRTASSSSAISSNRECDESDDLLSDYTSETTFFDAERSSSATGK
jgi:hypothetical protein